MKQLNYSNSGNQDLDSVLRKRKFERGLIEWSSWQQWQTPVELSKGKERLEKLEEERDNSIAIAGDANAPFSILNRITREKISKEVG